MLSVMEVILALKSTPLFREVPGEGLKRLSDFIHEKTVRSGEVVFAEQDLGDEMYLVRSGQVSVLQDVGDSGGRAMPVIDNCHFSEMASVRDHVHPSLLASDVL